MFGEKAYLQVKQAYQSGSYADFTATLKVAMELYAQDKSDGGFMARATEDQLKLMGFQSKMTAKHGQSFLNLPMGETLFKLVLVLRQKKGFSSDLNFSLDLQTD